MCPAARASRGGTRIPAEGHVLPPTDVRRALADVVPRDRRAMTLVTLIVGIEDTSGCRRPLDDVDIDRFRTVDAMAAFLAGAGVTG